VIRSCALSTSALLLLGCGGAAVDPPAPAGPPPAAGVMLLSLSTGAVTAERGLGEDPLAVGLAPGGRTAYVADNQLGDVFALQLPSLRQRWRTHVGGAPGPLLVKGGTLYVSEYGFGLAARLDAASGRILGTQPVGARPGELALWQGGVTAAPDGGFGLAAVGGSLWTWSRLPALRGLHPFWLQPGGGEQLLVTEEGQPENSAPGAVLALDTASGTVTTLATPRDPDQVLRSGADVLVAAHGDREVLVLRGGRRLGWARGASVVALAADPELGLLVVVTDADE
jgi:hypothetical protein